MWWAFRAEWRKITGNRWMMGCFMWLLPMAVGIVSLAWVVLVLFSENNRQALVDNPSHWTDSSLFFWAIPNSIIGRLLIVGFTAALFAGEYEWGTWKNLLPRRDRLSLILMKFVTLGVFVVTVFGITSIIWVAGIGLVQLVAGGSYPPALNEIPASYWSELALQIVVAFISAMIVGAMAALVAMVSRSILFSVIVGIGVVLLEGFVAVALLLLYVVTDVRLFPTLWRFSISYNVDNLLNWATAGEASPVLGNVSERNTILGDLTVNPPLEGNALLVSLGLLLLWFVILAGLAAYSFYRQDFTG